MGNFRNLRVWQASHELAVEVHKMTGRMRRSNIGKLDDQLLRAAMSIGDNIIEGNGHESPKEFARYLGYSLSSAWEVEGHLQKALDFGLMTSRDFTRLQENVIDVRRMLYGLIRKLNGTTRPEPSESDDDPKRHDDARSDNSA